MTGVKTVDLKNLSEGISADGRKGKEFFEVNEKIIDLNNTFLTDKAKSEIIDLIKEPLDPEGRENENVVQMMKEDGLFTVLPKKDDELDIVYTTTNPTKKKEIKYFKLQNKLKMEDKKITKFEFLLTLEDHIICQRFFNVKGL